MGSSGIYYLEPIRYSYLNVKLGLDATIWRRNSPVMQAGGAMKPLALVAGSAELPLLRRQTADFACHRASFGIAGDLRRNPRRRPFHYHERDGLAGGTDHHADSAVA